MSSQYVIEKEFIKEIIQLYKKYDMGVAYNFQYGMYEVTKSKFDLMSSIEDLEKDYKYYESMGG
jgi:hypothetical protein